MSKRIYVIPTERINPNDPVWSEWLTQYGDKVVKTLAVTRDAMLDATQVSDPDTSYDAQHDQSDIVQCYGREAYSVTEEGMKAAHKIQRAEERN